MTAVTMGAEMYTSVLCCSDTLRLTFQIIMRIKSLDKFQKNIAQLVATVRFIFNLSGTNSKAAEPL